jgi:DNA-binding response OmpR family regulator
MQTTDFQHDDAKPTVLVIDDSVDVHRLLKVRLRGEDVSIASAQTGDDGISMARESLPALILLDLDMPGVDGFEVLRTLKDNTATHRIPIIVLSGLTSPQEKVTAFDLGAVDYVTKPFDLTELRARIRSALQIHALLEMLEKRAQIEASRRSRPSSPVRLVQPIISSIVGEDVREPPALAQRPPLEPLADDDAAARRT